MFTYEESEKELNTGRRMILAELYNQKLISKEVFEDYYHHHGIMIKQPSFFSNFWKKFYKKDENYYILVKQKSLEIPEDNDPKNDKKADLKILNLDKEKKD